MIPQVVANTSKSGLSSTKEPQSSHGICTGKDKNVVAFGKFHLTDSTLSNVEVVRCKKMFCACRHGKKRIGVEQETLIEVLVTEDSS